MATPQSVPAAGPRSLGFTTRPETAREQVVNSAVVWLALMAYWALSDLLIALFPPGGRPVRPDDWLSHLLATALGLAGIWCSHRAGFPAAWDARISPRLRFLLPVLLGAGLGVVASVIDVVTGASKTLETVLGQPFNVAFPGSLLVYSAGAVTMELLYRLVTVPVLLWLISTVLLRGRHQERVFWGLALLSSAVEPGVIQGVPLLVLSQGAITLPVFAAYFVQTYALNLTEVLFYCRAGFLAAILVRLAYYLVWHIIYGNFLFNAVG